MNRSIEIFICLSVVIFGAGNALHLIQYAGETARILFERLSKESHKDFTGHRLYKNGTLFAHLENYPNSVYECTKRHADLEDFCHKTVFGILNNTHLLLEIKSAAVGDSGNYSVHWVFNNLETNYVKKVHLKVIEGHLADLKDNTTSEPSTTATPVASSASGISSSPVILFILVCAVCYHYFNGNIQGTGLNNLQICLQRL